MKTKYLLYIIDDDRQNLIQVSRQLRKSLNCSTRVFKSAADFILKTSADKPDLIITNYRVTNKISRKMNSDYLLGWFKYNLEKTPIIMYSTHRNIEVATKLIRKGVADFVVRDENFLKTITERTRTHLITIKNKGAEKIPKKRIVLALIFAIVVMLFLNKSHQNLLLPFSALMLLVFAFIVFIKEPLKRYTH